MITTKQMSVDEWIAVEDNPIQRDTERHAAKAKHLLTPLPIHQFVFAAQLPSGQLIKLDGHTRALLWQRGQVPSPLNLTVGIVGVKTREEAEDLYKSFDSVNALETMRDKVSGAFHRFAFEPKSTFLQRGSITYALRLAWAVLKSSPLHTVASNAGRKDASQKMDVYTMINEFSGELAMLDKLILKQGVASGLTAAFLVTTRKYGERIVPFWTAVFGNAGLKAEGYMDPVQALNEFVAYRRGKYGGSAMADLLSRAVMAAEKWLKDETMKSAPRPLDLTGYLEGHEHPLTRLIKHDDHVREGNHRHKA